MSDTFIIEVGSQAAGLVVRDPGGYRFFAATHRFNSLEHRARGRTSGAAPAAARVDCRLGW
ncbi:hypothetical protein [Bradyrhizobium sp.]|uniref:hypothetical protein n=1 Tax=Bradyrhizobium sp. TaxID=376 RepID=UPI0027356AE6|nr:hypothetical protein [Bradyrhizobium sp.]MDP3079035.1 hypothetical protein [Bradyrhizobium sp.]